MIDDTTPGNQAEPITKTAALTVIPILPHLLGDRHDSFLYDIPRLRFGKACLNCHGIDEFPVGVEKLLPTVLIFPIPQSADQTGASCCSLISVPIVLVVPCAHSKHIRRYGDDISKKIAKPACVTNFAPETTLLK